MLGVYAIVEPAATDGWTAPATLGFGAGVARAARAVRRCASARRPTRSCRSGIFRSRNVVGANLIQVAGAAGMFGIFFLGSLYLKGVLGYGAMEIGLAFLPTTVLMGALSVRFTEPLVTRFGARPVVVTGLALIAAGLRPVHPRAGRRRLRRARAARSMVAARHRRRAGLPGADDAGDVRRDRRERRAGLRAGQHDRAGRRRARAGRAGHAVGVARRTAGGRGHGTKAALAGGYHLAFWVAAALDLASS